MTHAFIPDKSVHWQSCVYWAIVIFFLKFYHRMWENGGISQRIICIPAILFLTSLFQSNFHLIVRMCSLICTVTLFSSCWYTRMRNPEWPGGKLNFQCSVTTATPPGGTFHQEWELTLLAQQSPMLQGKEAKIV